MRQIRIITRLVSALAELNDTKTADAIWQALPFTAKVNVWGNEVYFDIPVDLALEKGQEVVGLGDLGYWPPGKAFCIFFGTTPASRGKEIRAASPVTVFGRLIGDPAEFKSVKDGAEIAIEGTQEPKRAGF